MAEYGYFLRFSISKQTSFFRSFVNLYLLLSCVVYQSMQHGNICTVCT